MDKNSTAKVIIYGAEWCPPCHMAKNYLKSKGIEYEYRNVEEDQKWGKEAVEKSGQFAIPVIEIGKRIMVGFDRISIDEALKEAGITK
jgi:glutaredoxin 3